ncbi:MAG: hypothetical protein KME40_32095 [Komarekiella atlantica HA4396-MV6]|jgi:hypothetical protein|nr:hypothetical protein [Komarekiella atlantica HA4396-MV6]
MKLKENDFVTVPKHEYIILTYALILGAEILRQETKMPGRYWYSLLIEESKQRYRELTPEEIDCVIAEAEKVRKQFVEQA